MTLKFFEASEVTMTWPAKAGTPYLLAIRKLLFCILLMTTSSIIAAQTKTQSNPLQEFKKHADKFHSVISLPHFETTTNEVNATVKQTIADGNAALDIIGALKPSQVTLKNTIQARVRPRLKVNFGKPSNESIDGWLWLCGG